MYTFGEERDVWISFRISPAVVSGRACRESRHDHPDSAPFPGRITGRVLRSYRPADRVKRAAPGQLRPLPLPIRGRRAAVLHVMPAMPDSQPMRLADYQPVELRHHTSDQAIEFTRIRRRVAS